MKICPKCNELLGDAVKVCIKCKYQFEAAELQEHLDKTEEFKQIANERMQKNYKKKQRIFYSVAAVFLIMVIFSLIFGLPIYEGNGRYTVTASLLVPYEYIVTSDHIYLRTYYGRAKEVNVPDTLRGRPVTQIGDNCFSGNKRIVKVKIPETVNYIWFAAFSGCTSLTEVTGGKNVRYIDFAAFASCSSLATVDFGTELRQIDNYAFADSGLEEIEYSVYAEIGEGAFENTPYLDKTPFLLSKHHILMYYSGPDGKIEIPDVVDTLGDECFVGVKDSEIYIPDTVDFIPYDCFKDCTNIKIYIPASVEKMWLRLKDCSEVTIVTTEGSCAEEFAKEEKIPYEIVDGW